MIIVIQGRLKSTRLPAKGFFHFHGQTVWERVCDICLNIKGVDSVVFATSSAEENKLMKPLVERKGVRWVACDDEDDVLRRYIKSIEGYDGEYLIRITCDNYLVQPEIIEDLVLFAKNTHADYAYVEPLSHFAGEIVRCSVLRDCYNGSYSDLAREHVTWDIRNNTNLNICQLKSNHAGIDHTKGITLDDIDDFIKMKIIEMHYPETANVRCLKAIERIQQDIR